MTRALHTPPYLVVHPDKCKHEHAKQAFDAIGQAQTLLGKVGGGPGAGRRAPGGGTRRWCKLTLA